LYYTNNSQGHRNLSRIDRGEIPNRLKVTAFGMVLVCWQGFAKFKASPILWKRRGCVRQRLTDDAI
jgi:hypothetical protein